MIIEQLRQVRYNKANHMKTIKENKFDKQSIYFYKKKQEYGRK